MNSLQSNWSILISKILIYLELMWSAWWYSSRNDPDNISGFSLHHQPTLLAGINEAHTLQEIKRAINKGREEMSVTSGQIWTHRLWLDTHIQEYVGWVHPSWCLNLRLFEHCHLNRALCAKSFATFKASSMPAAFSPCTPINPTGGRCSIHNQYPSF